MKFLYVFDLIPDVGESIKDLSENLLMLVLSLKGDSQYEKYKNRKMINTWRQTTSAMWNQKKVTPTFPGLEPAMCLSAAGNLHPPKHLASTWSSADSESDVPIKGQEDHKTRSPSAWQEDARQLVWADSPLHLRGGKPGLNLKKELRREIRSDLIQFHFYSIPLCLSSLYHSQFTVFAVPMLTRSRWAESTPPQTEPCRDGKGREGLFFFSGWLVSSYMQGGKRGRSPNRWTTSWSKL